MKDLITAKHVEQHIASGGDPSTLPADALYTPSARDVIRGYRRRNKGAQPATTPTEPFVPDYEFRWEPGSDPKTPADIQRFWNSEPIEILKRRMAEMGRRIWEKSYVDGNGGNMTIRVGDNLVMCTPTLISKGFMKPEELCLVDFEGNQVAGARKRTSEVLTHIGIMKRQPKAKACVHAHPPHATAFAAASVKPPTCMIPEADVFLGQVGLAEYRTPGSPANSDVVGEVGVDHQAILMENHGVICWGKDIEDAYWKLENLDAYCRIVWIGSQLGTGLKTYTQAQEKELIQLRQTLGMDDKRADWEECQLCDNADFQPGVVCQIPDKPAATTNGQVADAETLVKQIANAVLEELNL